MAKVSGTVQANGSPVSEGTLTFYPTQEGKPGSAKIGSDGSFTMTTYTEGDGLVKGPGRIEFTAPQIEPEGELKPGQSLPQHELHGYRPKEKEITVEEGSNNLTIELVKP